VVLVGVWAIRGGGDEQISLVTLSCMTSHFLVCHWRLGRDAELHPVFRDKGLIPDVVVCISAELGVGWVYMADRNSMRMGKHWKRVEHEGHILSIHVSPLSSLHSHFLTFAPLYPRSRPRDQGPLFFPAPTAREPG
jgi:hypothetical protein